MLADRFTMVEMDASGPSARIDKWLWAIRIFKTRNQAADACRLNQVTILGQPVKPSRLVRAGDLVEVEKDAVKRVLQVNDVLEKRVGAKQVADYVEDLTSDEAWEKARSAREQMRQNRVYQGEEGGRPSKRDRRQMDAFESQEMDG